MAQNERESLDWHTYEREILDLFVSQNMKLPEVMAHMEAKHNFHASARQYKYRIPNLKNVKEKEWIWIGHEIRRRTAEGQDSEACLHGRPLQPERVARELARHKRKILAIGHLRGNFFLNRTRVATANHIIGIPNPSPRRISVRTPPLPARSFTQSPTSVPQSFGGGFESLNPQIHTSGGSIDPVWGDPLPDLIEGGIAGELESAGLAFDMEIETSIEASVVSFDLSTQMDMNGHFDFNWSPNNTFSPASMGRRSPNFGGNIAPIPSLRQTQSPPISVLNPEFFEVQHRFKLMVNLPWFRLRSIMDARGYSSSPLPRELSHSISSNAIIIPAESCRGVLSNLLGHISDLQRAESVAQVSKKLQQIVPERYDGELSDSLSQLLDPRPTTRSGLDSLFALAAYFASNQQLESNRMDKFLKWVIEENYTKQLEHFLQIDTPTTHAFIGPVLESAIRIKDIKFLTALLHRGVKFEAFLNGIHGVGDMKLTQLAFERADVGLLKEEVVEQLFHGTVRRDQFDLARTLVQFKVNVNCRDNSGETALHAAVFAKNIPRIRFLLDLGVDVNARLHRQRRNGGDTALSIAAIVMDPETVALLLKYGAETSCKISNLDILEWSSLHCRTIYRLLKENSRVRDFGIRAGDFMEAATKGRSWLQSYITKNKGAASQRQLELALDESVRQMETAAAVALLQHGVDPNGPTLDHPPLVSAVANESYQIRRRLCELLIKFGAEVNVAGILAQVATHGDIDLMTVFIRAGVDLEEQGPEALLEAVLEGSIPVVAFLLDSGVDINTPGVPSTPVQLAAFEPIYGANIDMVKFLVSRGADVNAPAYPDGGRTALQRALGGDDALTVASYLLDHGADILAPPALVDGVTALEAVAHGRKTSIEDQITLCNRLLDAGAPVNRPNEEPSSVLHGCMSRAQLDLFRRFLELSNSATIDHMWCDKSLEENDFGPWELITPIQWAAEYRNLEAIKMLLDRGADINRAPAYRFGRTALQAAASREGPDTLEIVQFLLERGADIHAKPALHSGITALQGAAIKGNIMVAKLLLDADADVNAQASLFEGRYAIEGAAEHGRLDMVQLLLNAGATGNVSGGTGFKDAIELAENNGYSVIADLLKIASKTVV